MAIPLLCLVGGFLGAGKTTAILAAAERLEASGARVAIVANDQGHDLVDASLAAGPDRETGRVEGGCFCCRFDDLEVQLGRILASGPLDVIFAEAVGSCTDLSATVLNPLRRRHPRRFALAPITVVAEPRTVHDLLLRPLPLFSDNLQYLFRKQLEEADVILLNKVDAVDDLREESLRALRSLNLEALVIPSSARRGDGIPDWIDALRGSIAAGQHILDLDYARYGDAEGEMAWLNARIRVDSVVEAPEVFLRRFLESCAAHLREERVCLHLKAFLEGPRGGLWGASTLTRSRPEIVVRGDPNAGPWSLLVNLRALIEPELAEAIARESLASVARAGARIRVESIERFRPASPRPTYRERKVVDAA